MYTQTAENIRDRISSRNSIRDSSPPLSSSNSDSFEVTLLATFLARFSTDDFSFMCKKSEKKKKYESTYSQQNARAYGSAFKPIFSPKGHMNVLKTMDNIVFGLWKGKIEKIIIILLSLKSMRLCMWAIARHPCKTKNRCRHQSWNHIRNSIGRVRVWHLCVCVLFITCCFSIFCLYTNMCFGIVFLFSLSHIVTCIG